MELSEFDSKMSGLAKGRTYSIRVFFITYPESVKIGEFSGWIFGYGFSGIYYCPDDVLDYFEQIMSEEK
jgi:hypothetical protein